MRMKEFHVLTHVVHLRKEFISSNWICQLEINMLLESIHNMWKVFLSEEKESLTITISLIDRGEYLQFFWKNTITQTIRQNIVEDERKKDKMRERRGKMKSEWSWKCEISVYNKIQISEKGENVMRKSSEFKFQIGWEKECLQQIQ